MNHYSSQTEKRILEPREIKRIIPFENIGSAEDTDGETSITQAENEVLTRAQIEADDLINQAHIEIAALKEDAQLEISEWKKNEQKFIEEESARIFSKAKDDGFQKGYETGLSEGTIAAHNQYKDTIDHAGSIVKQTELDWKKRMEQSEPFLIELSIDIAKKIILRELSINQHTLLGMVAETLKLSSELKEITLAVHPDDYHLLRSRVDELKALISNQANLILLPDHSITSGGCIIRSSLGALDVRVDTQLEEIKVALLDAIKGSEMDELEPITEI